MRTTHVLRRMLAAFLIILAAACDGRDSGARQATPSRGAPADTARPMAPAAAYNRDWRSDQIAVGLRVAAAAEERARQFVTYDPAYVRIAYPRGDVAADRGVCSDEVIRALRSGLEEGHWARQRIRGLSEGTSTCTELYECVKRAGGLDEDLGSFKQSIY